MRNIWLRIGSATEGAAMLAGKTAVIYGGGGAIGGAVARTFAREGATVHLAGRTAEPLRRVAEEIAAAGGRAETAVLDALDAPAVEAHLDAVLADAGRVDVTLNAIGVDHVQGRPLAELAYDDFDHPVATHLRAAFVTAKAAARPMTAQGAGAILTLSTPGARLSGPGFLGYGVACAAIEAFSRILAGELGPAGVRVVCLRADAMPDSLATSYTGAMFARVAEQHGTTAEQLLAERASAQALLRRSPTLTEIAEFAAFAASDRAGAMTGAIANLTCGSLVD